ncbi:hypothetical protein Adu01nite_15640 [Paractinoplanes durhamensis]|uniref:DUF998 domain-containing protein n=2 Tax=Paractinoplanes durhamensis TaxID=113563 RepID=A0ABQ3YRK4_9ACTN|nr:hypothetical protein Adu01nite_15640 [Actinoplanes durhamensis]
MGIGSAMATALAGLVAAIVSVTTPPRSGPFCTAGCVTYPYTDVVAFAPRDYWWLYPQSLFVLLGLALIVCVHTAAAPSVRTFSGIAVALAGVSATALLADYVTQLTVVLPSLHRGETAGLSLLSQYNPHGIFVGLENLGYLLLGLALLVVAAAFTAPNRLERGLRRVLLAGGTLTVVALPSLALRYGSDLEYRFEVAAITLTWITLIAAGVLLTRWFGSGTDK